MTASHLPYTRNGLKFFTKRGGLSSVEVEGICDRAARKYVARKMGLGGGGLGMPPVVMRVDLMSAYAQHLRDIIKERVAHPTHYDTPLEGFKGMQLNADGVETHVMMETTGHGALRENHFLDDGAYMVVKIIIEMVRMRLAGLEGGVGGLIRDLEEPAESVLLRMDIVGEPKSAKQRGIEAVEAFKKYIEEGKLSGWVLDDCGDCSVDEGCLVDNNDHPIDVDAYMYRAKFYDESQRPLGWVHIRQSVHNPNIALNLQSCVPGGCRSMAVDLFERFLLTSGVNEFVDTSEVQKFVK
uniref:Alpha-D-phosphohexomutase alpha/beta/alpha domain-containing protein n=1 Tax=Aegilops tauschii TaxID=37682 RepID=R7WDW8_AEGTA